MPGPGAGAALTGQEIQTRLGRLALDLDALMAQIEGAEDFLAANTDAELNTQYGINPADSGLLRAAIADLARIRRIYRGEEPAPTPVNFRQNVRKVYGLRT